jgi:hypothetical protein
LLRHADAVAAASDAQVQRDAIEASRLLLDDPDPVAPLISSLAEVLRQELTAAVDALKSEYERLIADLEASEEWQQLDESDRKSILEQVGLRGVPNPTMSTDEELLATLDSAPLATWIERRQALERKVGDARELAAKKLEPKSVTVRPPAATLKTPDDVTGYVDTLRAELLEHVKAGETVII